MDFRGNFTPRTAIALAVFTLTIGTLAAACQQTPTIGAISDGNNADNQSGDGDRAGLRLGALLPATGKFSTAGQSMLQTLSLIVDTVNGCGGVNDTAVNLVAEDEQASPSAGAMAMTKLISTDKANAVVGAFDSNISLAALNVAVMNAVPMISPGSTSAVFTMQAKQGAFKGFWARTVPSDTSQAEALAQIAFNRRLRTISTIVVNTDRGISFEKAFIAAFEKLGGKVLNKSKPTRHNPKGDLDAVDNEASATFSPDGVKPDAVVAMLDPETGGAVFKSAYEQGLSSGVQIILTDREGNEPFVASAGKTVDEKYVLAGAIGTSPGATGPALDKLNRLWTDKEEGALGEFAPQTWDAAALLMLAAQAAETNDSKAIKEKLREVANPPGTEVTNLCEGLKLLKQRKKINYQGASGKVDLDESGDILGSYDVWAVDSEGQLDVIDQMRLE